jgi:CheY-like chemotaxis protein
LKVLLADPNPTTQKVVELTLEGEEAELISSPSGEEALKRAESVAPQVILFSETLEDMDALQFHQKLKEHPALQDTPCIALISGRGITPRQLREGGISFHLEKPFEAQELLNKIEEAIQAVPVGDLETSSEGSDEVTRSEQDPGDHPAENASREEEAPSRDEEAGVDTTLKMEDEAEQEPEAPGEEEDFGISLKVLSDEIFQKLEENEETELEDEMSALQEMAAGDDGLGINENLLMELEEVSPDSAGATIAPSEPVSGPPGEGSGSQKPGMESLGKALGQYIMEAAQRVVDESFERVMQECMEKTLEELRPALMEAARKQLQRYLPRMAEVIIRQEIEKLKASVQQGNGAETDDGI